jgi:hypothetical protein
MESYASWLRFTCATVDMGTCIGGTSGSVPLHIFTHICVCLLTEFNTLISVSLWYMHKHGIWTNLYPDLEKLDPSLTCWTCLHPKSATYIVVLVLCSEWWMSCTWRGSVWGKISTENIVKSANNSHTSMDVFNKTRCIWCHIFLGCTRYMYQLHVYVLHRAQLAGIG